MNDRFYVGTRKGLFTFENGKLVSEAFLGIQIPMLLSDPRDGTLHAAVDHGHFGTKMHRSEDGGKTWEELDPPTYPEKPDNAPEVCDAFSNKPVPWSLEKVWALETGGADEPGKLWAGTIPGGLFVSEDRGQTWELNRPLWDNPDRSKWAAGGGGDFAGIHSICVHPQDSKKVAVAISCGGVWQTEDGGETWEQTAHGQTYDFMPADQGGADPDGQDPHLMVRCRDSPDDFWVQHHCGIFRSTNGGRQWEEIKDVKPSSFGFAVAVHPEDPKTAWFVPAKKDEFRYPIDGKFVVTRTRDGGETFETLTKGLPEPPAYDLVFRHSFKVDSTGQKLIMGSTTGGLWTSEDQGTSWAELSAHLPPVYCTVFA